MTSSYEQRIVDAMLRYVEALDEGDDDKAGRALVEAAVAARLLRTKRSADDDACSCPTVMGREHERGTAYWSETCPVHGREALARWSRQ